MNNYFCFLQKYSAKYGRSPSPKDGHRASSSNDSEHDSVLSSSLRQERDKHLSAILNNGNQGESSSTFGANQTHEDGNDGPINVKWQNIGDNMKQRFEQLFTSNTPPPPPVKDKKLTQDHSLIPDRRSLDSNHSYTSHRSGSKQTYAPSHTSPVNSPPSSIKRPSSHHGRVFGQVKDHSSSSSSSSSRPTSPNPFQRASNTKTTQSNTVSPFARLNE